MCAFPFRPSKIGSTEMEPQELFRAVVDVCVLILLAEIAASINARLRLPRILGPIFTGIAFGPYLLGGTMIGSRPFIEYGDVIYIFSEIGAILLLFEAGLHMKFGEIVKSGKASFTVATMGVVVPYFLGLGASTLLGYDFFTGMIIGGALTATSTAISLTSLQEMNQMDSPEAKIILGAAVIDDVLALSIASIILSMAADPAPLGLFTILRLLLITIGLWFLLSALSSRIIPKLTDFVWRLEEIDVMNHNLVPIFSIMACFGYASISGLFGLSPLVGAFIAGMAVSGSNQREAVREFTEKLGVIFVPLFFIVIGANVNPYLILSSDFLLVAVLALVAVVSKLVGCGLPAAFFLNDKKRGLRVGYGMISRGEIGLVIAGIGITYAIISDEIYTALVLVTFITTLLPPFLLRRSYLNAPTYTSPDSTHIRDARRPQGEPDA